MLIGTSIEFFQKKNNILILLLILPYNIIFHDYEIFCSLFLNLLYESKIINGLK